jgi:hypothetical protein
MMKIRGVRRIIMTQNINFKTQAIISTLVFVIVLVFSIYCNYSPLQKKMKNS